MEKKKQKKNRDASHNTNGVPKYNASTIKDFPIARKQFLRALEEMDRVTKAD